MPFSWKKKTRCNRFSQLVADHLQSPKRGGSLVVETGFPTSLIDLYVRNRGRFRKSGANKRKEDESIDSTALLSPSPSGLVVDSNNIRNSDDTGIDEIVEEEVVVGVNIRNSDNIEVELSVEMVKLNPVLVVVLKVLFVVVLVLLTKGFAAGITILAFLLLVLEAVGKRLFGRSSFNETDDIRSSEENTTLGVYKVSEIEEELELDEVRSEILMDEIKRKSSRRAIMKSRIMKSRMKKLVPKKLRKSSVGSKEEISYKFIEEESVKSSECSDSKGESLRILKQDEDKIVEIGCNDKGLGRGLLHRDSGCLVLCLIVLVGLIGGRVLALVLALSWCLMLKMLQWKNVKFPIS